MSELGNYIRENETLLMERILHYARIQGYAVYTSTLLEAWRVSIVGLSDAIIAALDMYGDDLPQFSPDDRFEENSIAGFGVKEAQLHRHRGISLQMFLGLYKYYRYAFEDIVWKMDGTEQEKLHRTRFVDRVLDLIEIAFCSEWSGLSPDNAILELRQSNREVTNEKNKYLTLFESLSIPAFFLNSRGLIENMNHAAVLMLGRDLGSGAGYYGSEDMKKELAVGMEPGRILPYISEEIAAFLAGESAAEQRALEKVYWNGSEYIYFSVRFARMKDVSGKFEGGVVTVEDITQRKVLENQLAQTRKLESIGQLAAGIAHEINTPIQFVAHNIEFMEGALGDLLGSIQKADSDSRNEDLEFLKQEIPAAVRESKEGIRQVSSIVQAFKRFAHTDQEAFTHISLNEVAENIVEITRNEWKSVAEVRQELCEDLAWIEAVRGELSQILLNIMMNAIQAVREKYGGSNSLGEIVIRTENVDRSVEISIADNGCGVSEKIKHRLYDPFFSTKEVGEGTGQGLYIVHTLIGKNNGKVDFVSEEGIGTKFTLSFQTAAELPD